MPTPWSLRFWCKNWGARDILWKFVLLSQFAIVLLYSASRLFIIVEAVINLRRLPIGVFEMVTWTNYFIHFWITDPQITFDLCRNERLVLGLLIPEQIRGKRSREIMIQKG